MKKSFLIGFFSFLSGFLISLGISYHFNHKDPVERTIFVTDTIYQDRIEERTITKYITKVDTIIKLNLDSIIIYDTIYIPIEHKQYIDTFVTDTTQLNLRIDFSGYKAKIDTVAYSFTYKQKEPLKSKKKGHLGQFIGVGIGANYGLCINPYNMQASFQPSIGIGIMYGWGYNW